jgi:hypothetical protein
MNTARWGHTATLLPSGHVLIAGGYQHEGDTITQTANAELYDPTANQWLPAAPMSRPRAGHSAVLLPAGAVLVNQTAELYYEQVPGPKDRQPPPAGTSPDWVYFAETGHYLSFGFRSFWQRSGGLPVFGYPLTEEFPEGGYTVQYFERQRFEYHPEFRGTPYEVELGRLGAEDASLRNVTSGPAFYLLPAGTQSDANCRFFAETRHRVCFGFLDYWQSHGLDFGDPGVSYRESLALFGYPLSEPFTDPATGYTVQYFERARFEWHPENTAPYNLLLGRLGADRLADRGW